MATLVSVNKCFGGEVHKYKHVSAAVGGLNMNFNIFFPLPLEQLRQANQPIPLLFYLSGLTCTEDNAMQKSGLQRTAASRGIAVVCPDTSPRDTGIEGEKASWDFGAGAGFYLNATVQPWAKHFNMYDYITKDLYELLFNEFPLDRTRASIFGHSMGGLGALSIALKNPDKFKSASAFAPISHPSACPVGIRAFTGYLGEDRSKWAPYDPTELVASYSGHDLHLLIDQGTEDNFYKEKTLLVEDFTLACAQHNINVNYRLHQGYDHGYYFVASFIDDHINHHADLLK